jgi:hypothetical protein
MLNLSRSSFNALIIGLVASVSVAQQQTGAPQNQSAAPALQQWEDTFDGNVLDASKWDNFAIQGSAAQAQVEGGQLKLRITNNSRAGIRSKENFDGERFLAEATIARANASLPSGSATLAVLFDDTGKSRIEWTLTTDGKVEAYDYTRGESERLDSRSAGALPGNAKLGIARRGDDFYFALNDQVILHRTINGVPSNFRVMLYGSGASEIAWDATHVTVQKAASALPASASSSSAPAAGAADAATVWSDDFNGSALNESKWEQYTFEGGGGLKVEVKNGQLKLHGSGASRSGVRSKEAFNSNDFYVEATAIKPNTRTPQAGEGGFPPGFAILTVLFNGRADKRIEWILTSDGQLQAWATINDRLERLDNTQLGTREKTPKLGIARRGDQILFLINRQVGLQRSIASLPTSFKVMLYGFGSTQNDWDGVLVQTTKQ